MTDQIVPDSEHRGLVARRPQGPRDLAMLARFDRPIGWWLLFWPCVWGVWLAGAGWQVALLGWLLLTLAVLDWRHFWLPDALTWPLAFLGFTLGFYATDATLTDRVIGAAAGYGALLVIALAYRAVRGREGLGLGDAKLLGALGAWMGWQALPFLLLCASMLGLVVMLASGRASHAAARAPLGTFLALAALPGWLLATYLLR